MGHQHLNVTHLHAKLNIECYDYSVAIDWNQYTSSTPKPYSGKSVKLSVTVKDPQDSASMSTLTQSFASLGDHPTLQLKNGTNVFTFGPSSFEVNIVLSHRSIPVVSHKSLVCQFHLGHFTE